MKSNSASIESLLRAVEELSPTDDRTAVSLRKVGENSPAKFTRDKRVNAKKRRMQIRLTSTEESRAIEISGIIAAIDVQGRVTLREVKKNQWTGKTVDCTFETDLMANVLENFAKPVLVSAIQSKVAGKWTAPEVVDVSRSVPRSEG
ncbi:MAG TPA: hypothetical protein VKT72_04130 [Candidatus Baltobacteraceae bacterium]|nr:hypothetical protein [Candidatus Baltobacteraceae bacterium]